MVSFKGEFLLILMVDGKLARISADITEALLLPNPIDPSTNTAFQNHIFFFESAQILI